MKIYKLTQTVNDNYDTYDSVIVVAENEEEARSINPDGDNFNSDGTITITTGRNEGQIVREGMEKNFLRSDYDWEVSSWCNRNEVKVQYIGQAEEGIEEGILLASFNAG